MFCARDAITGSLCAPYGWIGVYISESFKTKSTVEGLLPATVYSFRLLGGRGRPLRSAGPSVGGLRRSQGLNSSGV